ncbi:MAG: Maf family protein [Ignavibacteria bacterium]|jgi:septum formation protein|nr:Maf family protein [Ignavibacteria bacterium]
MNLERLKKFQYILASQSPRRKQLLNLLGLSFKVFHPEIEENHRGEKPLTYAKKLAQEKAEIANKKFKDRIIIAADTIVVLDNQILEKPKSKADAKRMLKTLSGRTHIVYTAVCVINQLNGKKIIDYEKTFVTFRKLSSAEIDEYVETGSCMDKAGAYGIQDDLGAVFVSKVNGCYYNVVGLPLQKLYLILNSITK